MWQKELPTGSWIDCLKAIEKEISHLNDMLHDSPEKGDYEKELMSHDVRVKFGDIWRYAGIAVKDLERT